MQLHSIIIYKLQHKWKALHRFRLASSVLMDYRILRNYAFLLNKQEQKS